MKFLFQMATVIAVVLALLAGPFQAIAGDDGGHELAVVRAVMCETVEQSRPVNEAAVFSIELGRVSCFTEFENVSQQTVVYHKWYRKDGLITVKRLWLNPSRRVITTSMQLRNADKGPWRVDVTDTDNRLLATLRFSITE